MMLVNIHITFYVHTHILYDTNVRINVTQTSFIAKEKSYGFCCLLFPFVVHEHCSLLQWLFWPKKNIIIFHFQRTTFRIISQSFSYQTLIYCTLAKNEMCQQKRITNMRLFIYKLLNFLFFFLFENVFSVCLTFGTIFMCKCYQWMLEL